jgi:hypothetical protein
MESCYRYYCYMLRIYLYSGEIIYVNYRPVEGGPWVAGFGVVRRNHVAGLISTLLIAFSSNTP